MSAPGVEPASGRGLLTKCGEDGGKGGIGLGCAVRDHESVGAKSGPFGENGVAGHEPAVLKDEPEHDITHAEAHRGGGGAAEEFDEVVVAAAAREGSLAA